MRDKGRLRTMSEKWVKDGVNTSAEVTIKAFQSILGSILTKNFGFNSMVSWTNSASFGWRGNDAVEDLQALTAQVRKLRVRIFIFLNRRCREGLLVWRGPDVPCGVFPWWG